MTGRTRLYSAINGDDVDRVPIWLREGFELLDEPPDADDFLEGWRADRVYENLLSYVAPYIDYIQDWRAGNMNRFLMIPDNAIHKDPVSIDGSNMFRDGFIRAGSRKLTFREQWKRNNNNRWLVSHPVESVDDLISVSRIPWHFDCAAIEREAKRNFKTADEKIGDRGILRFGISSPIVVISGLMNLQLFLEISYTHRDLMHDLLAEITERTLSVLGCIFQDESNTRTTANLGGSEQVTPPLMAPEFFDEYVVPYDSRIVDFLKGKQIPVNMHCHGKIRYALNCMKEMGIDSTDPVEPPPAGDLTFAEAREIADGKVTLIGNVEYNEFTHLTPPDIRKRVKDVLSGGKRRIILSTSAGPNTHITSHIADNYRSLVDSCLEYGG